MVLFLFVGGAVFSQNKTIVVLGSSTALGNKASPAADSSYVSRLKAAYRKNINDGVDTIVQLLAHTGYNTYNVLPDDYVLPSNRTYITIDPERNITKTLTYSPDVVIINLPSNDPRITPDYNLKETMDNFRLMYQMVTATGAKCFITTPQPRDDFNPALRLQLRQLVDSVINNFGLYALNFWDDLVTTDGLYSIRPEVHSDDNIHVNNYGHRLLFERIMAKNIFNPVAEGTLPVVLTEFSSRLARNVVDLKWRVELEEPSTYYELQRSGDGTDFITVSRVEGAAGMDHGMDYFWTDRSPLDGNNFYRLKIIEPDGIRYSFIISCGTGNQEETVINKAYINRNELIIEMVNAEKERISLSIFDPSGQIIRTGKYLLNNDARLRVPFANTPPGIYIIKVYTSDGKNYVKRFMKPY